MKQESKNSSTLLFTVLIGLLLVVSFISYQKISQFTHSVEAVIHTNSVKSKITEVMANLSDAQSGQRAYILTEDEVFLQPFNKAQQRRSSLFATLDSLLSDDTIQRENLKKLKTLSDERYKLMNESFKFSKDFTPSPLVNSALLNGKNKMDEVREQIAIMLRAEDELLLQRTHVKDRSATFTPVFLLMLSLFSILIITIFFFRLQKETSLRVSTQKLMEVEAESRKKIEISEARFRNLILQAPVFICTLKGPTFSIETINESALKILGKSYKGVMNMPLFELLPELEFELKKILQEVYTTGEPFFNNEIELHLKRSGKADTAYFNLVFQPLRDLDNSIFGIIIIGAEVTESVKARKLIEESEERFSKMLDNIPHLIWTATPNGSRNFFNKYFIDYTGSSFDDLKGDKWQKIIFPEDLEKEIAQWERTIKTGEDFKIEKRVRHHSGSYRWHLSHGIAQKDNDGNIIGWIGSNTDITEQKEFAEKLEIKVKERTLELEERKNFVETILETSKEYVAVFANDFTLISLNKAAEEMMQRKREDLIGKKFLEIMPNAKGTKSEQDLQNAFDGHIIHNKPFQSLSTGTYLENYITPLTDIHGNVYAALAIATDVTSITLKQIEIEAMNHQLLLQNQTFELAENIANFGSYKWNITTGVLEYSDNLFRLLDCEPQEFVPTLETFISYIHPDDKDQFIANSNETKNTGELAEAPYRVITKAGTIKYFRSSGNISGEGDNHMMIGTVQDITKDVIASMDLKAKNTELENANIELASFSYVASHDLQEPLRKIQAFSKRIIDKDGEKLSDTTKDYFTRIIAAAQRMQNLIEALLTFSRTNITESVFEKTDLNQILKEVQTFLHEIIVQKGVVIEAQALPTLNAVPVQMHQLFLNLIGNAIKYAKPDVAPHIKISAEKVTIHEIAGRVRPNGVFWKITISDNGIGFEQQYENKIFELFQRLHGKTEYEGTGIGLAICKKIVQTHSGTITATGQLGTGSTFIFFLPDNTKS